MTKKINIFGHEVLFNNDRDSLFSYLLVLRFFMNCIEKDTDCFERLKGLIEKYRIPTEKMGFPKNWKEMI